MINTIPKFYLFVGIIKNYSEFIFFWEFLFLAAPLIIYKNYKMN